MTTTSRSDRRSTLLVVLCLTLLLSSWLPLDQAGAARSCEAPALPVDDERASRILAEERPFGLTEPDLFHSYANPDLADAAPLEIPRGPELSEEETRDALRDLLERRFPCSPDRVRDGLAVYGDPQAQQKVPEPALRAALAALTGTLGEPAIRYLLYQAPVTLVHFGVLMWPGDGWPWRMAGAVGLTDGTLQIVMPHEFRFLPFAAFSALLFHEILHTGARTEIAGLPEEAVAIALEALVYMEMLLVEPALAELPDRLTRDSNNRTALVRLNSGPQGTDRLTLFVPSSDVDIDPTAVEPLTEFYEYYVALGYGSDDPQFRERETAGNPLLRAILPALAEPGASPPAEADFDEETVAFVDQNQAVLSPAELIAVACILKLDVPCD
jgi:hypothetical protein